MKKALRYRFAAVSLIMATVIPTVLGACNVSVNKAGAPGKEPGKRMTGDITLVEAEYPFYFNSIDNASTIKLYFADEGKEIPYVDTETIRDMLERTYQEANKDEGYMLTVSEEENRATFTRENGYLMTIDGDKDVIVFPDYDGFFAPSWSSTVIDTLEHYGKIDYLQIDKERSYSRFGAEVDFDLAKYGIDVITEDGRCYIPLQTFSDIALSLPCYTNLIYNGKGVFAREFTMEDDEEFIEQTYDAGPGKRSGTLAEFTYDELCMVLDHFYGLKEQQGIEDFDDYFVETGLKYDLLSEDAEEAANTVADFLQIHLDDLHSFYMHNSYLTGADFSVSGTTGSSYTGYVESYIRLMDARHDVYRDEVPGYEEVGNTAYVTFDVFETLEEGADYYKNAPTADTEDTVGLLLYAFSRITRKGSPVENVVFDLSLNGGGDQTTTCFMLSMILGRSSMVVKDTMTGAYVYESFQADANLDGVFDEKDSLSGYDLYCITSPNTFSCGNLAASELKNSNIVTMLGRESGGGTCIVMPITLADGTVVRISSCRCMSVIKNGSLYDIDRGVEPDIYIGKPSSFYDRKKLTEYINSDFH